MKRKKILLMLSLAMIGGVGAHAAFNSGNDSTLKAEAATSILTIYNGEQTIPTNGDTFKQGNMDNPITFISSTWSYGTIGSISGISITKSSSSAYLGFKVNGNSNYSISQVTVCGGNSSSGRKLYLNTTITLAAMEGTAYLNTSSGNKIYEHNFLNSGTSLSPSVDTTYYINSNNKFNITKILLEITEKVTTPTTTFDANGGNWSNETTKTVTQENEGDTVSAPAVPGREGYTFGGWYDSDDATQTEVSSYEWNKTYKAKWDINQYDVKFDDGFEDLEAGNMPATQKVDHGNKVAEPATKPTLEGYDFAGWYNVNTEYDFNTPVTGALTLTAKWNKYFTITVNGETQKVYSDGSTGTYTLPVLADKVETGEMFAGWIKNGETTIEPGEVTVSSGDVFTPKYDVVGTVTVSYYDGESLLGTSRILKGTSATKPEDPSKEGYEFVGWYVGDTEYNFDTPITEDITITAKWEKILVQDVKAQLGITNISRTFAEGKTVTKATTLESILPGAEIGSVGRSFTIGAQGMMINHYNSDSSKGGYFDQNSGYDQNLETFEHNNVLLKLVRASENEYYISLTDNSVEYYLHTNKKTKLYRDTKPAEFTNDYLWTVSMNEDNQFMFDPNGITGDDADKVLIRIGDTDYDRTNCYDSTKSPSTLPFVYVVNLDENSYDYDFASSKASARFTVEVAKAEFDEYLSTKADTDKILSVTVSQGEKTMTSSMNKGELVSEIEQGKVEVVGDNYKFAFIIRNISDLTTKINVSVTIEGFYKTVSRELSIADLVTLTKDSVTGEDLDLITQYESYINESTVA